MKFTRNIVFEKTFDMYFFIAAKFHSEGVKMGWNTYLVKYLRNYNR